MNDKIIKTQSIYSLIDYEPFVILIFLVIFAWVFYKLFLREASEVRHRNLKRHFQNLLRHSLIFSVLFTAFKFIYQMDTANEINLSRTLPYLGILTLFWGMIVFVKTSRLIILQYLFLGSMKSGVPILLVNIFSLVLSITLTLWSASFIFGVQLGPLLATSAAFSIILGLAMQDTLGNLFAGISLQFDRSFEIGDWLEIINGSQKVVGQVKEITWRATSLVGFSSEFITLPNRLVANSQISNFLGGELPFIRNQSFRLPLDVNIELAKKALFEGIAKVKEVRKDPQPLVYIFENTDSWITLRLVYFINSYGEQYIIGDKVQAAGIEILKQYGIPLAHQVYIIGKP